MTESVAVLGASGFVGSAVVDRLERSGECTVTPFASSTGGASALANRGRTLRQIDLLNAGSVAAALAGFDYVVNCSRGGDAVMRDGFDNLLAAAKKAQINKLVHISSVAVYGDPPPPDSATEDAPTTRAQSGYGAIKRDQDDKLRKAAAGGLGAISLCPPNIIGPFSDYLLDVIESIERGRFRLIDAGQTTLNVVDVDVLAAAVARALAAPVADGRRLFVNQPEALTWADLCSALTPVLRGGDPIPAITADGMQADSDPPDAAPKPRHGAFRHLISEDVREALKTHPRWAAVESAGKATVRALGGRAERSMRQFANGPIRVDTQTRPDDFDRALVAQQLRGVRHRPDKLIADLDFRCPLGFAESMQRFNTWYRTYLDAESHAWQLLANRAE